MARPLIDVLDRRFAQVNHRIDALSERIDTSGDTVELRRQLAETVDELRAQARASVDLARTLEHFAEAFAARRGSDRSRARSGGGHADRAPTRAVTTAAHHWVAMPAPDGGPPMRLCAPVDPPDILAVDIGLGGWQYPEPLQLLLDLVVPGTTFLDLGAHLGTVSLCVARRGARA